MSTRHRTSQSRRFPLILSAIAILLAPEEIFVFFATESWQVSILRLTVVVSISVIGVWPWVRAEGGEEIVRLRRWVYFALPVLAYYLLWSQSLFLVIGFSLTVGAALDMWVSRAHAASERLRTRLGEGSSS